MTTVRRTLGVGVLGLVTTLIGCHDAPVSAPSAGVKASLSIAASVSISQGGSAAAFARADSVFVRVRAPEEVRGDFSLPFQSAATQTGVRVAVPLRQATETLSV